MVRRMAGATVVALCGFLLLTAAPATAAPAAAPAGLAPAAAPDHWGFAFSDDPAPPGGYIPDTTRQWGSWKPAFPGWATVQPVGVGRFLVRFPQIASRNGVAHVTAVSGDPRWCQVEQTFQLGPDQGVLVQCYRHGGVADWTRFAVMYSTSSKPTKPGAYAYVLSDPAGGLVHSYNSTGAANAAGQSGVGVYRVHLPKVGTGELAGHLQVTAQSRSGVPRHCKVGEWQPTHSGYGVVVRCFDGAGAPADSGFNLTYHRERAVFGGLAPPKRFGYLWSPALGTPADYNSAGAANSVGASGVGQYLVRFGAVGVAETHVQVTGSGHGPDYCGLQEVWKLIGGDAVVRNVICFDGVTGARADNRFFVSYTSRV